MYIVTSAEMRALDHYTINTVGIPAIVLMENAGAQIAREVIRYSHEQLAAKSQSKWLILVGKGNNGGDGLVLARHLKEAGYALTIVYTCNKEQLSQDAFFQYEIVEKLKLSSVQYSSGKIDWEHFDGIVDALLGTGAQEAPRKPYASLIQEANASGLPIISVDVPSGLNADTGEVYDPCILAQMTAALAFTKCGLTQYPGVVNAGEVVVKPIGISPHFAEEYGVKTYLSNAPSFENRFQVGVEPERDMNSHKGTYGHVLISAGSLSMSGAGLLCSRAAVRGGCGLVTWAVPLSILKPMLGHIPEVMLAGMEDSDKGLWQSSTLEDLIKLAENKHVMVVGPGMGRFHGDSRWLRKLWEASACPLVLDADALNMLADAKDFADWRQREAAVILTPHPGEMARLTGLTTREVQRDRIGLARRYAVQHGVTLVLKGARTVVATPEGVVYVNTTGNPGMATGGAGDVLAGLIGSLLAQGMSAEQAAALGVYRHGAAGDRAAAKRHDPGSLTAGDIIDGL